VVRDAPGWIALGAALAAVANGIFGWLLRNVAGGPRGSSTVSGCTSTWPGDN
jgi:hypothetical protein